MNTTLQACLADLEVRLDAEQEERLRQAWVDFAQGRNLRGQVHAW